VWYKEFEEPGEMRYSVNTGQVISEIIDGEAVMINLTTGNYYSLNEVGAAVWEAVAAGASAAEAAERMSSRYDGSPEEIAGAVESLIEQLKGEELIVPVDGDGPAAEPPAEPAATRRPFEPPRLEKHTDMQDLILLDPVHEVGDQGWPHVKTDEEPAASR
jgi:hypothetical protein